MSKIEYGVQIEPQFGYTYDHIRDVALQAEKLGFESLWTSDHFLIRPEAEDVNCLECWTVLSSLAAETKTLRLGNMVASQNYRNPVLHAKIAASLDHISNGRVYFGIGAGWKEVEYKAYNMPFPAPWVRIRQLRESLEIARRVWSDPVADYQGKYYSVNNCVNMPKPVQEPMPVMIGGMGYQLLKISAKYADAVNFAWNTPLDTFKEKQGVLRKHCEKIGTDYDAIKKSAGLHLALKGAEATEPAPYEKYSGARKWEYKSAEKAAEFIRDYVDLGASHFVIVFPYSAEAESIRVLMDEVAPLI
ncbi:MAG: LLM class flavin-dependent oxidoreductase [Candidatus Bathyarchaeota archaeon]|nr:LLM class flavin-dependent oxidoreductase [Candidatus Bathyarchaeota archaeon]